MCKECFVHATAPKCLNQEITICTSTSISSVTRFGEISPLWQLYEALFSIWQTSTPSLPNFLCYWAQFSLWQIAIK